MKKFLSTSLFLCISFILISELHDLVLGVMASCRDWFDYSLCMVASETTRVYPNYSAHCPPQSHSFHSLHRPVSPST